MRRAHDVERPSSVVAEEMRLLKPSASELQGKAHKFDTVAAIKRRNDHGVFFRWSKRKKRFIDESTGGEWNDGKDDGGRYDKDRRARATLHYQPGKRAAFQQAPWVGGQRAGAVVCGLARFWF